MRRLSRRNGQGVERAFVAQLVAHLLQAVCQQGGVGGNAPRNALQADRAVVDRVHAGHYGGQDLRGTDVGSGLFAPDMLLTRLQRQPVGRVAMSIDADAYQPTRHGALEVVAAGHVGGVWATVAQRHAKTLGGTDGDVGTQFARRRQQGERQ